MLEQLILERYFEEARDWLARREQEPAAWRRAGQGSDYLLYLTAVEARRLTERIDAMTEEFVGRNSDPALRPKGSRMVRLVNLTFPSTLGGSAQATR